MGWAAEEFKTIDLGDARLDARAVALAERLGQKPTESIPNACSGWAETQAAYRFLSNEKSGWEQILTPHWRCSTERMRAHAVVLNIQDTTELDFNGRQAEGLGPLSFEAQRGLYLHPTYVVSPAREPLGVLDAWMWAREPRQADGTRGGLKESTRWIEGYERVAQRALELPEVRQVYVADREADILALLLKAREVQQQIRAERVELPHGKHDRLELTCLVAHEIDPPAGVKPVVWRLLTNRRADTLEQAVELIDWYRARWEIELFFLILKEGCRIEAVTDRHNRATDDRHNGATRTGL